MDNLRRQNIIVNACLLCLQAKESIDQLPLNCKVVQGMLVAVL